MADGKVVISTALDNSGVEEDAQKMHGSLKSQAMKLAHEYKKQGMSMSDAMKKAWSEIERSGQKATKSVGSGIKANIGGSTDIVTGKLGGLNSVVKKLGSAIAVAFSVTRIIQFAKESVEASMRLSNALQGLQSILDGQGRSFSDAQQFIEEYTADGLIPATNAITAYKNLAARGYDDTQIRRVMIALKDASAFGRQASYTMGEAVQSATEGLKNENSILVDNAGVTKNVAKMWEEYAESIGTTSANLTQQQKIQAEVNGILEESKYQAGDAEKVAGTLSGQLSQLSFNFEQLKVAVGDAIAPIIESVLPIINDAIAKLTEFANAFAVMIRTLTGATATSDDLANNFNSAADGAENLEGAITSAGKAAKKYLAPFDEIAKISNTSSGSSSVTGGLNSIESADESRLDKVAEQSSKIAESWAETAKSVKEIWYETLGETSIRNIENYNTSLTNLKSGWENLIRSLGTGGEFSIAGFLADIIDATILSMAGGNKTLGGLFDLYAELRKHYAEEGLSDNLLDPVFKDADVWDALGETISGIGMTIIPFMAEEGMYGLTKVEWENLFLPITEEYTNFFKGLSVDAAEALSDFGEEYGKLKDQLAKYRLTDAIITENDVSKVESMTKDVIDAVTAINDDARKKAEQSVLDLVSQGLMSDEEAAKALAELDATYSQQEKLVKQTQESILSIVKEAQAEGRKLDADENRRIQNLLTMMKDRSVAVISQGADDSTDIYEKLAENRGNISKQMLSETIQYANDEHEASVQAAQDNYDAAIENANRLYNDLGVIDEAEYERIKADAENKRKIQVDQAKATKDDLIKTAKEAAGGVADAVDPETGEILSNWELIWNGMYESVRDAWEAIKTATKNALNSMIGFINTPIAGLNALSTTVGGKTILGAVMPSFSLPQIPLLAKGAVLPPNKPFMAVVGDQKHGTNIEAPLTTIQEAVAIVMEDVIRSNIAGHEATVAVLREILEAVLGIHIGDDVIGEAVARYNAKMAVIRGGT